MRIGAGRMELNAEHIAFAYEDKPVLEDVSAVFHPGRCYGILGPNGCGKTTFLDLLLGFRRPQKGNIRFRGKPLSKWRPRELAMEMALVPQDFYIKFPFTVREIVMMGRYPHLPRFGAPADGERAVVDEVMEAAGIAAMAERRITELSGGERQRVVFARALAQEAAVLFLDEATSNLDVNHALHLLELVRRKAEEKRWTVIAVFQDINLAALFCTDLLFMKNGRIVAAGPQETVFRAEMLQMVFGVESKVCFDDFAGARQAVFRGSGSKE